MHSATVRNLARFIERHSAAILIATVVLSLLASIISYLGYDDDVVRFLPHDDPSSPFQ